ncbi:MAG: DNA translocase FtsK, partial [bacterium]
VWSIRAMFGQIGAWLIIALAAVATVVLWSGTSTAGLMQAIWMGITTVARVAAGSFSSVARSIANASQATVLVARNAFARVSGSEPAAAQVTVGTESLPVLEAPTAALLNGAGTTGGNGAAQQAPQSAPATTRQFQQGALSLEAPSGGYQLPPVSLLIDLPSMRQKGKADPAEVARLLEQTLTSFGVEAKVMRWEQGPVVTRFEVQPAPGVRVQKISSLTNDIALALAAPSVRIEAPIPGKSAVGIELPNQKTALVHIKELLESEEYRRQIPPLTVALGKDIAGHPILGDLAEMPHVLIAGATGSGKSVMLNAIIAGLLFRCTPLHVRLLMIDPKRVEFTNYNNIPHLLAPVVTNPRAAAGALKEMLREMEERFERFAASGVRNIQTFNQIPDGERLPFIVIIIDELADLMMIAPADFEDVICRLAQMTRATGIHMVLATQRPSVDVITGLIKANIPSRIAFAVSSQVDSRTILDMPGAEKLLGKGDMLYMPVGLARPVRAQGAFIADSEIQALVTWWKSQGKPIFDQEVLKAGKPDAEAEGDEDALLAEAGRLIVRAGYGSVSLLQRKMKIGYVRAARIVDQLEEKGVVGPTQGSNPREVLVGIEELEKLIRTSKAST